MKHRKVNVAILVSRLKKAAGTRTPAELAASAKIDASRISRFLNGEFKKVTPVLERLCSRMKVEWEDLLDVQPTKVSPELLNSLRRIVGRDPQRIRAAGQLLRSLEVLTQGSTQRVSVAKPKQV